MLQPPPLAQWLHHLFMGFFSSLISITLQHKLQLPQVLIGSIPSSRSRPSSKSHRREPSGRGGARASGDQNSGGTIPTWNAPRKTVPSTKRTGNATAGLPSSSVLLPSAATRPG